MDQKPTPFLLSIVIPCHNEAQAIHDVLPSLRITLLGLEAEALISASQVIVVDDGSSDDTPDLLCEYPWVENFRLAAKGGYGAALKFGFSRAKGEWIAFFDLDGTYDPLDLRSMILAIRSAGGPSLVLGNRLAYGKGMPFVRRLGNHFFTYLAKALFRCDLPDICTGYRLFRRELLPEICALPDDRLNFSLSMSLWAVRQKVPSQAVPIRYHERRGLSKLSVVSDGLHFFWTVLSYFFVREHSPPDDASEPSAPLRG